MPSSTRKILIPITWPAGKIGRGHLLPDLHTRKRKAFVRVPGGRPAAYGMVGFVGQPVMATEMFERWESSVGRIADREQALDQLDGYVRWVAAQKIGSVFEAAYDSNGTLMPTKVADSVPVTGVPIPD